MLKVECPRCRGNFEVPDSLEGSSIKCPECDYENVEVAKRSRKYNPSSFFCQHCGGEVYTHTASPGDTVQCPTCKLDTIVPPPAGLMNRPLFGSRRNLRPGSPIICFNPNCGYRGPSARIQNGNVFLLIIFFLLGVIPGLIYAAFFLQCSNILSEVRHAVAERICRGAVGRLSDVKARRAESDAQDQLPINIHCRPFGACL